MQKMLEVRYKKNRHSWCKCDRCGALIRMQEIITVDTLNGEPLCERCVPIVERERKAEATIKKSKGGN